MAPERGRDCLQKVKLPTATPGQKQVLNAKISENVVRDTNKALGKAWDQTVSLASFTKFC